MFKSLLLFEFHYQKSKPLFYVVPVLFFVLGILIGRSSGISFPNMFANSPYQISYLATILSLAGILVATILVAQSVLREDESKFAGIIYTTPANKITYMLTRFLSLWGASSFSMLFAMLGLFFGQQVSTLPAEKFGPFNLIHYISPFLLFILPNIGLCVALLCSSAWISRSKLMIFITGLLIYILYIAGSIFSNSPLIAGLAPADPNQVSLFAKLDPFGIAAFFEQTRYWSAEHRNTLQISLNGNMLFNRFLWLGISLLSIAVSLKWFSSGSPIRKESGKAESNRGRPLLFARHVKIAPPDEQNYFTQSLQSFVRIDLLTVVKGIPFIIILIIIGWLLCIEFSNATNGNSRSGESYATSSLMFNTIKDVLPSIALLVLLFFSSELIWKSKASGFYNIERSSTYSPLARKLATIISLSCITFLLISLSIILGITFQFFKGYPTNFSVYGSLYYYLGFPLFATSLLIVAVQHLMPSRYPALAVATIIALLSSTSLGNMVGLNYPLLRFGFSVPAIYSDMNGYGGYNTAFLIRMVYCSTLGILVLTLDRNTLISIKERSKVRTSFLIVLLFFFSSSGFIFYQASVQGEYQTQDTADDWKQVYELKYKTFENFQLPTISSVKTNIHLYPSQTSYRVSGRYVLTNKTKAPIDSILVYIKQETELASLKVHKARLISKDDKFGHYWFLLDHPLTPGKSTTMTFSFSSSWSGIIPHESTNSIIPNGSFLRISTFFPSLGYDSGNELTSEIKRSQRKLRRQKALEKLETPTHPDYDYKFIEYEAVLSTEGNQIAITSGDLKKKWKKNERNYFHYKSDRPMPFRFAISTADYKVSMSFYNNIPIEVYYHPSHSKNVIQLIKEAKKTLKYAEKNFGKYPHRVVRFAEVSAFAEGFAATSYPGVIYMKENGGFFNNIESFDNQEEINKLAGHELSHQWWGSTGLNPEFKEGGWILTETIAKYTELMLYRQAAGRRAELETVRMHLDLYLSNRSYSKETPLYKTTFDTPHIPYDKGMVVMHQVEELMGEGLVNASLKDLYDHHRFPLPPPASTDLMRVLLSKSSPLAKNKIRELFKEIITYDARITNVTEERTETGFKIFVSGEVRKYKENGQGKRVQIEPEKTIQLGVEDTEGKMSIYTLPVREKKVSAVLNCATKASRIVMDPNIRNIDISPFDNERTIN